MLSFIITAFVVVVVIARLFPYKLSSIARDVTNAMHSSMTSYQEMFVAKKGERVLDYRDRKPPLNTLASPRHFVTTNAENAEVVTTAPMERLIPYRPISVALEPRAFTGRSTNHDTFVGHYPYAPPRPHVQDPIPKLPGLFETTLNSSQRSIIDAMLDGSISRTVTAKPMQLPLPNIAFEASTTYKDQYKKPYYTRPGLGTPRTTFRRQPDTRDFQTTKSASYLPPVSQRALYSPDNSEPNTPRFE